MSVIDIISGEKKAKKENKKPKISSNDPQITARGGIGGGVGAVGTRTRTPELYFTRIVV